MITRRLSARLVVIGVCTAGLAFGVALAQSTGCGVRKVRSRGVAVFVDESAESVAPVHFG
jgi:adenine/guanine phosphoribosyltransferase-like PRPP-binding protein